MIKTGQIGCALGLVLAIGVASEMSGCASKRAAMEPEALRAKRAQFQEQDDDDRKWGRETILRRIQQKRDAAGAPGGSGQAVCDVLVVSGGGDWGAFGAGVLKGWGKVSDPALRRPEFDVVTGVSTGALIAPFAFVGDDADIDTLLNLYCNPKPDWVRPRGALYFMPSNPSLAVIDGLERDIRAQVGKELVGKIAEGSRENRVMAIGCTNADVGMQRAFMASREAENAARTGDCDRFQRILLASSAIPGAFPAVEIDDFLYIDGGTTSNILFNADVHDPRAPLNQIPPSNVKTKVRMWIIINNAMTTAPETIQPVWPSIVGSGVSTAIRSATVMGMRLLELQVRYRREVHHTDVEFRYIAIPDDWTPPVKGNFVQETMKALAELGEKMGADPASWKTELPPP